VRREDVTRREKFHVFCEIVRALALTKRPQSWTTFDPFRLDIKDDRAVRTVFLRIDNAW
jgi:hypothetical protein